MGHTSSVLGILAMLAVASAHAASGAAKPGRWIVFSAFPNGVPPAQLFRVQVTNEGLQQITHSKDTTTQPAFSPNGKRVVFARVGSGIFVMNLFGSGLRRLTSGHHDFFPVYSPDGKRIAFTRQYRNDWRLYVMTAAGKQLHRLRHAPPSGRPSWTANGKSIYIPAQGSLTKVDARTGRLQTYIQPKIDVPSTATVSPNSRQVAFVGARPSIPGCGDVSCLVFALYLADVSKGRVHRFVNDAGPAGWSSDGKTLVFVYRRGIILWPLAGGAQATLATGPNVAQADAPPAWQPR